MFNVRLAGGHLYGKQLFTWLSLVVSFMASFVLSFFPLDVLDGIWDLIESVSEGFLTYSYRILTNFLFLPFVANDNKQGLPFIVSLIFTYQHVANTFLMTNQYQRRKYFICCKHIVIRYPFYFALQFGVKQGDYILNKTDDKI